VIGLRLTSRPLGPAAVFAGTIAALAATTAIVLELSPSLGAATRASAAGERPPEDDYYLANDIGGQVDHHVLYHGIDDEALAHLSAAQVLFLGNSRLMFALRPAPLRPFFAAAGHTYYALGFGHREADRFPLAILQKFDLRPDLVVVNADGFFGGGLSTWAELVHRDSMFAARKLQWEAEAAHVGRRAVHVLFPHWPTVAGLPGLGRGRTFNAYRSRFDGTWEMSPWPLGTTVIPRASQEVGPLGRGERVAALAFLEELRSRGSRLVLTVVPNPEPMPGASAVSFAALLDVPLVTVHPPGLATFDNSHLDAGSAHDWTRAFLDALRPHLPTTAAAR
jgi:hypothetical protein